MSPGQLPAAGDLRRRAEAAVSSRVMQVPTQESLTDEGGTIQPETLCVSPPLCIFSAATLMWCGAGERRHVLLEDEPVL